MSIINPDKTSWAQLFIRYWKRTETSLISKEGDKDIIESEIEQQIHPKPTNSELCDVIRWMAGPDCNQKFAPTMQEFIKAIRTHRKIQRINDAAPAEDCTYCYQGKIPYYPDYRPGWTALDFSTAYSCSIPCLCSSGHKAMLDQRPWRDLNLNAQETLRRQARTAMQAVDARKKTNTNPGEQASAARPVYPF